MQRGGKLNHVFFQIGTNGLQCRDIAAQLFDIAQHHADFLFSRFGAQLLCSGDAVGFGRLAERRLRLRSHIAQSQAQGIGLVFGSSQLQAQCIAFGERALQLGGKLRNIAAQIGIRLALEREQIGQLRDLMVKLAQRLAFFRN